MNFNPFPGYENHLYSYCRGNDEKLQEMRAAQREAMSQTKYFALTDARDIEIDGPDEGQKLTLTLVRPRESEGILPVILYIHGGGFLRGNIDAEFAWRANVSRCAALAVNSGSLVVSVDYRLLDDGVCFPAPLLDCHKAYQWLQTHGQEIQADGSRIGLYGVSAGGSLAEGLALYLRDRNEQMPTLTALDCPLLSTSFQEDRSFAQMYALRMGPDNKALSSEARYLGGYDGRTPSYYAYPALCHDVGGLGPHLILAAEYDTLRDAAVTYARRLLSAAVPTELTVAPRVGHCFGSVVDHPYSALVYRMVGMSFQRELGLLEHLRR